MPTLTFSDTQLPPLVSEAVDLVDYLSEVREDEWEDYEYVTPWPPCHDAISGKSTAFRFGDHPDGGIVIHCFACPAKGRVKRIEAKLGIRLAARMMDGTILYNPENPGRVVKPKVEREPLSFVLHHDPITLRDLLEAAVWIVVEKKGPAEIDHRIREPKGWRQSISGDFPTARFGGHSGPVRIIPWRPYLKALEGVKVVKQREPAKELVKPALCFGGNAEYPYPLDVGVLDCDYKPANDPMGIGARGRDELLARCQQAGMPCFYSNSGNGFHALFRYNPAELLRTKGKEERKLGPGLSVDLFYPGVRRLAVVNVHKPVGGKPKGEMPIPQANDPGLLTLLLFPRQKISEEAVVEITDPIFQEDELYACV